MVTDTLLLVQHGPCVNPVSEKKGLVEIFLCKAENKGKKKAVFPFWCLGPGERNHFLHKLADAHIGLTVQQRRKGTKGWGKRGRRERFCRSRLNMQIHMTVSGITEFLTIMVPSGGKN